MSLHEVLSNIQDYGYSALFFCLWLGIIGLPIPDEMVVMSGGFVLSLGILKPIPAFIFTYFGVISGLSLGFMVGRLLGVPFFDKLIKGKRAGYYHRARNIIGKYGNLALVLSYFIPVVRHIVPYLVGMNKMSFRTYALYSYTAGLVWTMVYFILGSQFGSNIVIIVKWTQKYGLAFGVMALAAAVTLKLNSIKRRIKIANREINK